jgi:N-acetylneuraminic acid mutarotase
MKRSSLALSAVLVIAALLFVQPADFALSSAVLDQDMDGCSNGEEIGPNESTGGRRNPQWFWDFFDVPTGGSPARDGNVSGLDFFALLGRFGSTGDPGGNPLLPPPPPPAYHTGYDRGPAVGPDPWDLGGANGSIAGTDFFAILSQFGHTCLDPEVLGTWTSGATMPTARTEVTAATIGDVIYVIGGFPTGAHTNVVEAYDISENSWSTKAPLPQAIDHAGAATVNGKLYVIGGYINLFNGTISSATYEYDPLEDEWTPRASMPLARAAAATVEVGGVIYVLGGVGPQATVPLSYNPANNTWAQGAPISAPREHLTASVEDGLIYVIGGRQNGTQNVATVEVYDPVANDWETHAPLPTARGGLASGTLGGSVHVVGGENLAPGGSTYPQHEVYDPDSDTWMPGPPLPTPRHGLAAQVVGGKLYVIGGGPTPGFSTSGAVEIFQLKP